MLDDNELSTIRRKVHAAVESGELIKPKTCELCGCDPLAEEVKIWNPKPKRVGLVAHHWKGYDHPLEVWWVCYPCNRWLIGQHNGKLTKAQTIELFKNRYKI